MSDLSDGAVDAMRHWAKEGLGFNCTFADDDMKVLVGLAQRAVLAGLAEDFPQLRRREMREAAEKSRAAHEAAIGRPFAPLPPLVRG